MEEIVEQGVEIVLNPKEVEILAEHDMKIAQDILKQAGSLAKE